MFSCEQLRELLQEPAVEERGGLQEGTAQEAVAGVHVFA